MASRGFSIQTRIAAGLNQKELAERLGLKEQQIQREEATDDASASLTRVYEVARSLGLKLKAKASVVSATKKCVMSAANDSCIHRGIPKVEFMDQDNWMLGTP